MSDPVLHPAGKGVLGKIRAWFLTGVLVTAPVAITLAAARWLIDLVDSHVIPLIPSHLNPDTYLRAYLQNAFGLDIGLPGLGLVVLGASITVIGALATGLAGRYFVQGGEALLRRMPVLRGIYSGSKQILETILNQQSDAFRQAVLIEYPRRGTWAFGFVAGACRGEVGRRLSGDYVNVYIPTTPNPTSGFLLFVPRDEMIVLDMPVEDAFKMMISTGLVTPLDKGEKSATKAGADKGRVASLVHPSPRQSPIGSNRVRKQRVVSSSPSTVDPHL